MGHSLRPRAQRWSSLSRLKSVRIPGSIVVSSGDLLSWDHGECRELRSANVVVMVPWETH